MSALNAWRAATRPPGHRGHPATFELFVRTLPPGRNFLVAAGLEQALHYLETLAFGDDEIAWLEQQGGFAAWLLNIVHFLTLIASKAARMVLAAQGRRLVHFGMRRAHGGDAALLAARAAWPFQRSAAAMTSRGSSNTVTRPLIGLSTFGSNTADQEPGSMPSSRPLMATSRALI